MKNKAFTLIELSIVLVIIGLIVGGVLVGQDLIRAAQLRSIYEDVTKFEAAVQTFKLKYNCIAGDCPNATTFWGADAGCPSTASNAIAKEATCNGNGDKKIGDYDRSLPGTVAARRYEYFRFWQQLANAGLIIGSFSGTSGSLSAHDCGGDVYCPASKAKGRYAVYFYDLPSGHASGWFVTPPANYLFYGEPDPVNGSASAASLTPIEAKMIDDKNDDGAPGTGRILAKRQGYVYTPNCVSGTAEATATYRTDLSSKECSLNFQMSNGSF